MTHRLRFARHGAGARERNELGPTTEVHVLLKRDYRGAARQWKFRVERRALAFRSRADGDRSLAAADDGPNLNADVMLRRSDGEHMPGPTLRTSGLPTPRCLTQAFVVMKHFVRRMRRTDRLDGHRQAVHPHAAGDPSGLTLRRRLKIRETASDALQRRGRPDGQNREQRKRRMHDDAHLRSMYAAGRTSDRTRRSGSQPY